MERHYETQSGFPRSATLSHDFHAPVSTIQWVVSGFVLVLGMVIPVSCWAMERFGAKQMWMCSARNCVSHKCAPPGSESPDSRDWMSAVTESGGWLASTATRMPRSV